MNKKVLKTMISLVLIFLAGLYVLKIFFPEQFVLAIENDKLILAGKYIDTHKWAYYLFGVFTSFITYWFYCCAVCRRWYLKWWECLVVLAVIGCTILFYNYDINLYTALSYSSFVFLPALFKADMKNIWACFTIHLFSQMITLSIRNLPLYFSVVTNLNIFLLSLDMYLWLVLLYLFYNFRKKEDVQ